MLRRFWMEWKPFMENNALVNWRFTSGMVSLNIAGSWLKMTPRSRRLVEATRLNIAEKVEKIVVKGTHLKKKQLSALVGVPDTIILRTWPPGYDKSQCKMGTENADTASETAARPSMRKHNFWSSWETNLHRFCSGCNDGIKREHHRQRKSKFIAAAIAELQWLLQLVQQPYSLDHAPSDFY